MPVSPSVVKEKQQAIPQCPHGFEWFACRKGCKHNFIADIDMKCRHGRYISRCRPCRQFRICRHRRFRSQCFTCRKLPLPLCYHGLPPPLCKMCQRQMVCQHNRRRSRCMLCCTHSTFSKRHKDAGNVQRDRHYHPILVHEVPRGKCRRQGCQYKKHPKMWHGYCSYTCRAYDVSASTKRGHIRLHMRHILRKMQRHMAEIEKRQSQRQLKSSVSRCFTVAIPVQGRSATRKTIKVAVKGAVFNGNKRNTKVRILTVKHKDGHVTRLKHYSYNLNGHGLKCQKQLFVAGAASTERNDGDVGKSVKKSGNETARGCAAKTIRKKCPTHNTEISRCRHCAGDISIGNGLCIHNKRRSRCAECGGGEICIHGARKDKCKQCIGTAANLKKIVEQSIIRIFTRANLPTPTKATLPALLTSSTVGESTMVPQDTSFGSDQKNNKHRRSSIKNSTERCPSQKDKTSVAELLTGCTMEALKVHLERQWEEGMSWRNHTRLGWHIDHIRPWGSFKNLSDPRQQQQLFHFTNLKPMWARENCRKGDLWWGEDTQWSHSKKIFKNIASKTKVHGRC